jgi:hypothetical protein
MNNETKRPKKDFKIECNISWMVAGIFGILCGLFSTFQNKLLCWITGIAGVIAFAAAIYFLIAKPTPLEPSVTVWVDENE